MGKTWVSERIYTRYEMAKKISKTVNSNGGGEVGG